MVSTPGQLAAEAGVNRVLRLLFFRLGQYAFAPGPFALPAHPPLKALLQRHAREANDMGHCYGSLVVDVVVLHHQDAHGTHWEHLAWVT